MTPLRQRLFDDLPLKSLAERPQEMDVRAVRHLAEHDHKSPDRLTAEERRDSFRPDACQSALHPVSC